MKKRILALLLCAVMVLPLAACNRGSDLPKESQISLDSEYETQIIGCGGDTEILSDEYDIEAAKTATMHFSVNLFQESLKYEKESCEESHQAYSNLLISPLSVYMALGMLENGAKGESLSQIEQALGMNVGQMNSFVKAYLKDVSDELKIANSIWFTEDKRFTINDDFVKMNKTYYGADLYQAPFDKTTVKAINDWVEGKTDGFIQDILDEIPPEAVMYLINALVFEAEWADTYDETQVRRGVFHLDGYKGCEKQSVDMMYSEEQYYLEDENAIGFLKYYEGGEYAFVALLPEEDMDVYSYVASLSGEQLQNLLEHPIEVHVNAAMPQFKTEYQVEMKEVLKQMGIVDVFDDDKADLSGLGISTAGNIYTSRVIHKTFIEVTPVGTKAGAATIVECVDESAAVYENSKDVILDRPFIYMIIDRETNQPIFMGTVNRVDA